MTFLAKALIASTILLTLPVQAIPPAAIRTQNKQSICTTKTSSLRDVSAKAKAQVYKRDNVPGGNYTGICDGPRGCEVDHRIALWDGGSNDPINLTIQPYFGPCNATHKDFLEVRLHALICQSRITPAKAQKYLYDDWKGGYKIYVDPKGCE